MKPPIRYQVFEFIKEKKNSTDEEILEMLNKKGTSSMNEVNKALMDLEILGAITVRWVSKDKRRVEYVETAQETVAYGEV